MMSLIKSKLLLGAGLFLIPLILSSIYIVYQKGVKANEAEVLIQQQENYIETRRRIDEATSGNRSVSDAVDRLRARQQTRDAK
jgi:hypothetical protein